MVKQWAKKMPVEKLYDGIQNKKSIVVLVERKYQHPFLKKIIKNKKKYHAHDEKNIFKIGDIVRIEESKPYSKNKRFKVLEKN